jgi:pimeloyl-ACP methyl ester carboxylesterase
MHHAAPAEDRVFGRPDQWPANELVNRPSRSFDLLSVGVRGEDVAYAQEGRLALPPLVLLHGWGASHKCWRHALTAFSPRRRCIAPDLPGFGLSRGCRQGGSIEAYADWMDAFLDALGLDRVALAGHSMGGTIALRYALKRPERVARLVLANPVVHGATALSARTRFLLMPGIRRLAFLLLKGRGFREWLCRDFTCVGPLDPELAADVAAPRFSTCVSTLKSVRDADLRDAARSLRVPTLSIGTDLDRVVAPGQHALVEKATCAVLEKTGHLPMVERPAAFNRLVAGFLDAPGPGSGHGRVQFQ